MPIQSTLRVPGRLFIQKYQRTNFPIAKVPRVKLTLECEPAKNGKIKTFGILENAEFDADVLDDLQPLNKKQFRRRQLSTSTVPGRTRVFAYLLSTKDYTVETQVQLRYTWSKQQCRKQTPAGAPRPWAKCLYQYRARHVVRYKFRIDREMEKYSGTSRRWEYDGVVDDARGWQDQRMEGAWTRYALLKPHLAEAPCVLPPEREKYSPGFQTVGKIISLPLYPPPE